MEKIIIYLEAIKGLAKDLHYTMSGAAFYGNHLLMDRIQDGLSDYQDAIKENFFMYLEKTVPTHKAVVLAAAELLPADDADIKEKLATLAELLKTAIYQIESALKSDILDAGDSDLLGRISSSLKTGSALLGRVLIP